MLTDPRVSIIDERLKDIQSIIAISSGKGGVGKSLVASTLALALTKKRYKVGLFDLDFTSPSTHMILGIKDVQPKEDKGIIPPNVHGLEYMSIVYYSGDFVTPLRGTDASNVLVELLSITKWSKLDFLILDMPPGISDTTLDLLRLVKRVKFIIVTTSSVLAFETVKKLASLLKDLQKPVLGVIENMKRDKSDTIEKEAGKLGFRYLGSIPYDEKLEEAIGYLSQIEKTDAARSIAAITLGVSFGKRVLIHAPDSRR